MALIEHYRLKSKVNPVNIFTFCVNNTLIYMSQCSFLVLGGPLDTGTGSRPSVVDEL